MNANPWLQVNCQLQLYHRKIQELDCHYYNNVHDATNGNTGKSKSLNFEKRFLRKLHILCLLQSCAVPASKMIHGEKRMCHSFSFFLWFIPHNLSSHVSLKFIHNCELNNSMNVSLVVKILPNKIKIKE